jgi:hypothetical protein
MNRAWIVVGSVLTVGALVFTTGNIISQLAHDEETVTETFDATDLSAVEVSGSDGSIEVVGGPGDEIRLVADIDHGLRRTGTSQEIEGSTLVLRSSCPLVSSWCRVDYRLEVPARLAVTARTDNGRITVRDIDGPLEVDADNGSIELVRVGGTIRGSTDNGSLVATGLRSAEVDADSDNGRVSLTFASPPRSVEATTEHGSVEVVVPDDQTIYRVVLGTDLGSSDVGVRTDPDSDRVITARSDVGSVSVRYPSG